MNYYFFTIFFLLMSAFISFFFLKKNESNILEFKKNGKFSEGIPKDHELVHRLQKQQRLSFLLLFFSIILTTSMIVFFVMKIALSNNPDTDLLSKVISLSSSAGLNYYSYKLYEKASSLVS